ncbi:MAG: hypothetical protein Q9210_001605 [Variospora velana]
MRTIHDTLVRLAFLPGIKSGEITYRPRNAHAPDHDVHLLQRQSLRFRHVEPQEDRTPERHQPEEDKSPVSDMLEHIRRNLPHDEVGHPIRRRAEGDAVRVVREGPDFADEDPRTRTPAVTEVNDKKPNHCHGRPPGCFVLPSRPRLLIPRKDDRDNHMTGSHPQRPGKHDWFAA